MKSISFALLGVLAVFALPVNAAVVTVLPDPQPTDMSVGQVAVGETTLTNGWSIVTNALGYGKLCDWGPSTYFSRTMAAGRNVTAPFVAGAPEVSPDQDLGRGAFYATCDMFKGTFPVISGDKTPSSVWLGTDQWNGSSVVGRTLGSITALDYYSFVDKVPTRFGGVPNEPDYWGKASWWNGPQQPIQLQFTVVSPDDPTEVRQLWYRPWGYNYVGDDGINEPGSKKGRWQRFNCMTWGKWYMPCTGITPNHIERGWEPTGGGSTLKSAWQNMMEFQLPEGPQGPLPPFGQWTLAGPIWKSPGWNKQTVPIGGINATGTGKPINFFVGARVSIVAMQKDAEGNYVPDTGLFLQNERSCLWPNSSYGERAQVDYFTLGFDGVSETYDFEPSPSDQPRRTVAASCGLWQRVPGDVSKVFPEWPWRYEQPIADSPAVALQPMPLETTYARTIYSTPVEPQMGLLYTITGRVCPQSDLYNSYFVIDDGSKLQYQTALADCTFDGTQWIITNKRWDAWTSPEPDSNGIVRGRIRVYLQNDEFRTDPLWIGVNDIVTVTGFVEPMRWWGSCPIMWTNINNVRKVQNF